MKILEKIKDLFTDEIIEEKETINGRQEEDKLPTIMREKNKIENNDVDNLVSDNDLFKDFENLELDFNNENKKFKFPISFDESDLLDDEKLNSPNIVHREKEKTVTPVVDIYPKKEIKNEKVTMFKVSPVISPVYGILDKNYKKDEVQAKHKNDKDITRNNKKIDFESVRKKAYGSLVDDIKDNLSTIKEDKIEDKELSFYELKENINEITIGEIEDNFSDFGITIDNYNKDELKKEVKDIIELNSKEEKIEKIDINEMIISSNKQDDDFESDTNNEKNNDIFNLIDNMYLDEEEKNDWC